MRLLIASDIHCDLDACASLVDRSGGAEALLLAGDFARQHQGLEETIQALAGITTPTFLVPGNNERPEALVAACADWPAATVLHGAATPLNGGFGIFGLGGGIPPIGVPWSFDLSEAEARREMEACPQRLDVLLVHSPPHGHVDVTRGQHVGSRAILDLIRSRRPRLVVCGHIHDCWEQESRLEHAEAEDGAASTLIINAGPRGRITTLQETR